MYITSTDTQEILDDQELLRQEDIILSDQPQQVSDHSFTLQTNSHDSQDRE